MLTGFPTILLHLGWHITRIEKAFVLRVNARQELRRFGDFPVKLFIIGQNPLLFPFVAAFLKNPQSRVIEAHVLLTPDANVVRCAEFLYSDIFDELRNTASHTGPRAATQIQAFFYLRGWNTRRCTCRVMSRHRTHNRRPFQSRLPRNTRVQRTKHFAVTHNRSKPRRIESKLMHVFLVPTALFKIHQL